MPGEWNVDPSLLTTVCGSSSWLVQVTVVPTGIVSVAGANAKLVMFTAFGPAGAGASAAGPDGMLISGIPGIDDIPAIPGVAPFSGTKVSDGGVVAAVVDEQPAMSSAAESVANTSIRDKVHPFEVGLRVQSCGPLIKR